VSNMGTCLRVLVIDPDATARCYLRDIIDVDGYQVQTMSTLPEALGCANLMEFHAIIIDIRFLEGDLHRGMKRLRQLAPDACVIVAADYTEIEEAVVALREGASDYLLKPVCPDLLRASLGRWRQLVATRQQLSQSERLAAIGAVVAGVAHESRNALQRIRVRVDLIRLMHEDSDLLGDLLAIDEATRQLQAHFDELREYSAPVTLCCHRVNMRELLQQAWQHAQVAHEQPDAQLSLPSDDLECWIDSLKIQQVMRNLLENSLAACSESPHIEVTWQTVTKGAETRVQIRLRDNGPGLSPNQQQHAFDPFFTTKGSGTGLGLAICRRLVEAHGGRIDLERDYADGASFLIELPHHGTADCKTATLAIAS